jgi:Domain of unknown function (DUF5658)
MAALGQFADSRTSFGQTGRERETVVKRFCILTLVLFVTLSACDFLFTYLLVEGSGGEVYEANPVAATWLADHGWVGLAAYKAAAVFVVIGAVALIVRRKPAIGVAVACAACLATAAVNLHSHKLLAAAEADTANVHYTVLTLRVDPDAVARSD